ncbi:hypothetical protein EAE91_09250 [Photorhabdus noenieputensis]|nr:hypothetical protein [Photorhabdus noenieputensis]
MFEPKFYDLYSMSIDGSIFGVPDSDENRETFGFISNTRTVFPQVRMVVLISIYSYMVVVCIS